MIQILTISDNLQSNLSDIDMRQNGFGNDNSAHEFNFDQRRFRDLDNFQDVFPQSSQPVTHEALRDILSGLVPPQHDNDLNRNSVRPPPPCTRCLLGILTR